MDRHAWGTLALCAGLWIGGCDGASGGADAGAASDAGAALDAGSPGVDATTPDAGGATDAGAARDAGGSASDPGVGTGASVTTGSHTLTSGTTSIPLTLYFPAASGPAPVVVFHHGFQLGPDDYASYGEHLASWGYVVVMPQMPGGLFGGPTHRDLADHLGAILDWIEAGTGPIAGRVDAARIALAGHSLGGKISLLVATSDARVRAVFGVDPVDAGAGPLGGSPTDYPSVTPELMSQIDVPIVLLGETTNATCTGFGCMPCAPAADNFHQYYANATGPALEIEVVGANHMSFLDDPACGFTCSVCSAGTDAPATTRELTRRAMTAFFEVVLRGDDAYRSYLTGDAMRAAVSAGLVRSESRNGF